jgi:hypothetical protein
MQYQVVAVFFYVDEFIVNNLFSRFNNEAIYKLHALEGII